MLYCDLVYLYALDRPAFLTGNSAQIAGPRTDVDETATRRVFSHKPELTPEFPSADVQFPLDSGVVEGLKIRIIGFVCLSSSKVGSFEEYCACVGTTIDHLIVTFAPNLRRSAPGKWGMGL
jgi:hypothetical protein